MAEKMGILGKKRVYRLFAFEKGKEHPHCSTAVPISERGFFLTAYHCVEADLRKLTVIKNGREISARVIEVWPERDLALLKTRARIPAEDIFPLYFGRLKDGQSVVMIGLPGFGRIARRKIASGLLNNRNIIDKNPGQKEVFFPPWVNFNFGCSGGPVIDAKGRVIAIYSSGNTLEEQDTYLQHLVPVARKLVLKRSSKALLKAVYGRPINAIVNYVALIKPIRAQILKHLAK